MLWQRLCSLLYPPKCIFCQQLLGPDQTDLCPSCRQKLPFVDGKTARVPFSRRTVAALRYEEPVRGAILRYKFHGRRQYAAGFGRLLAMQVYRELRDAYDCVSFVPVSRARLRERGYDQAQLLAEATAEELGCRAVRLLQKRRNVPAQSGIQEPERRKANVLGVYRVPNPELVRDRRILLIDDVITTGATLSECCKTLLDAGAREIVCAALATAQHDQQDSR